jgi:hypothetical protein
MFPNENELFCEWLSDNELDDSEESTLISFLR